jgi:hypothetical protein
VSARRKVLRNLTRSPSTWLRRRANGMVETLSSDGELGVCESGKSGSMPLLGPGAYVVSHSSGRAKAGHP